MAGGRFISTQRRRGAEGGRREGCFPTRRKRRDAKTGFQSLENRAKPASNDWKNGETGFQSLENGRAPRRGFPSVVILVVGRGISTQRRRGAEGGKREGMFSNAEKTEERRRGEEGGRPKPASNDWKKGQNWLPMIGKTAKPGSNDWKTRARTPEGFSVCSPRLPRRGYRGYGKARGRTPSGFHVHCRAWCRTWNPDGVQKVFIASPPVGPAGQPGATDRQPRWGCRGETLGIERGGHDKGKVYPRSPGLESAKFASKVWREAHFFSTWGKIAHLGLRWTSDTAFLCFSAVMERLLPGKCPPWGQTGISIRQPME